MGFKIFATIAALAFCSAGGSACAMEPTTKAQFAGCTVSGGELLPIATGGAAALCAAIAQARGAAQPGVTVDVRVVSPHMMAATQTLADGRRLAEVKTASADRPLAKSSFDLLAEALAAQLADARG
jgi:hypothetical protein